MISIPTFQFSSTNAAAKAAAFSFAASALFAGAQAPAAEKSAGPTVANKSPVGSPANGSAPVPVVQTLPPAPAPPQKSFVSIGDRPAVLFDAPSNRANKTFIILRNTPLEVLVKLERMTKVRDADGAIGWVENDLLGTKRHVQVSVSSADVRVSASLSSGLAFDAQRGVLLEVVGPSSLEGWLPIRHRDGQTGFVRSTQVWGD